jgi:hypothetical protein
MSMAAWGPASKGSIPQWLGRHAARRDPGLTSIEGSLRPDERIEATAYCSAGMGGLSEAGFAALTDSRILFAPRKGPVRSYPYGQVRAVHQESRVGQQRRIRVGLADARPLHLLAGIVRAGADPCEIIRRHCRIA